MNQKFVYKTWGTELWFDNNDLYCGKELFVEYGKWSSKGMYHYHKLKTETFFVTEGVLHLDYIVNDNEVKTVVLSKGSSFRIEKLVKHRFTSASKDGCRFIEVSTTHSDLDSYRCEYDPGMECWIEEKSS